MAHTAVVVLVEPYSKNGMYLGWLATKVVAEFASCAEAAAYAAKRNARVKKGRKRYEVRG